MSGWVTRIVLVLIGVLLACAYSDAQGGFVPPPPLPEEDLPPAILENGPPPPLPQEGLPPAIHEEPPIYDYVDAPPTKVGERIYGLTVEFINGYVTGIQDLLDKFFMPVMYLLEKLTEQLDQIEQ